MDMKIDSELIKTQRERRAWSQEHLAEVSGLGLRTIQRIEKNGAASFESARSLAAVFDLEVAELRVEDTEPAVPRLTISIPLRPLLGIATALVTGGALFVASKSFADQVLLDVSVALSSTDETREWKTQMIVDEGTLVPNVNDLRLEDLRFEIVPKLLPEDRILLEMRVFEVHGADEVLVTSPRLVTADGQMAEVITGSDARSLRFAITPRRQPRTLL